MIQDGRHKARAIEWKLGVTSKGSEQIGVLFQLDDGQTITWYGYFSDKTVERTLESLEHMGWDGIDIAAPVGLDKNEVSIVVEAEQGDDGNFYPRVRWVNKLGGGLAMKEELAGHALNNFRNRMKGAVLARKQNKPTGSGGSSRSRDGDDIPF